MFQKNGKLSEKRFSARRNVSQKKSLSGKLLTETFTSVDTFPPENFLPNNAYVKVLQHWLLSKNYFSWTTQIDWFFNTNQRFYLTWSPVLAVRRWLIYLLPPEQTQHTEGLSLSKNWCFNTKRLLSSAPSQ